MKYKVGENIFGFVVDKTEHIDEINADAYLLTHEKTKAKLIYLGNKDDNKVFSVTFRTPPHNSTGVAHIIEHSVLCGSDKFPLKEPFVELVKGSLNTFLNAMTYPDKTMYPVASRNAQDFHNLMEVYLDAVFYPVMRDDHRILMQEGWHYEVTDPAQPIIYKGVVYNEMKGALSSPDDILQQRVMEVLFPDTTYGVESGGDPDHIPDLTFAEFKEFYETHYHPSNAYFFLYGDMDIEQTLEFLDKEYLARFSYRDIDSSIATQAAPTERKIETFTYGISREEQTKQKTLHAIDTVLHDTITPAEALGMSVLNYVLLQMPGALLKEKWVEAGVGADVSGVFIESLKQPVWHIEIAGSEPEKQKDLVRIWDETLVQLCTEGIPAERLEAALNRIEFTLRENDFQGRPKGLFYNIKMMNYWLYDREPLQALRYEPVLARLRAGLTDGFYTDLLCRMVQKNSHQAVVTLRPQPGLAEEKEQETAAALQELKESLTPDELTRLQEETAALQARQQEVDSEEALAKIPLLTRQDLPQQVEKDVLQAAQAEEVRLYHYEGESRGILYTNLYFSIPQLTQEEYFHLVLLTELLTHVGTERYSHAQLAQAIDFHTGGIAVGLADFPHYLTADKHQPFVKVSAKALQAESAALFDLLDQIINKSVFTDVQRIKDLVAERKTSWDMEVFRRGHTLMMNRVLSYVGEADRFRDLNELSYYEFLSRVVTLPIEATIAKLQELVPKIFCRARMICQTAGTAEDRQAALAALPKLVNDMPIGETVANWQDLGLNQGNEAFISVGKVQYVAQGGNFGEVRQGMGALRVLESILRYEYLWQQIRVLGGAYGAFAQFASNGNAVFCSYRDPNLMETLEVYRKMPDWIADFAVTERAMTQYVIGTLAPTQIQYTLPMRANRAMGHLFTGITPEYRQQTRDEIISCTPQDIRALAPLIETVIAQNYIAVMGGANKINEHRDLFRQVITLGQ